MYNLLYHLPIMNKSNVELVLKIEGENIEEEGIDMFVLIPALLSIGKVIKEANYLVNKIDREIVINIKPISKGSIEIDFVLKALTILDKLFSSKEQIIEVLANLGFISMTVPEIKFGLLQLLKFLKGEKPQKIEKSGDSYKVINIIGENTTINWNVYNLLTNSEVRKNIVGVSKILEQEEVKKIESYIKDKPEMKKEINKEDIKTIKGYSESHTVETENITERVAYLKPKRGSVEGERGNWSFRFGEESGNTITATIEDESFLNDLKSGKISLNNLDLYKVQLREKQVVAGSEIKETLFEIVRVLEVQHKPSIGTLFEEGDENG